MSPTLRRVAGTLVVGGAVLSVLAAGSMPAVAAPVAGASAVQDGRLVWGDGLRVTLTGPGSSRVLAEGTQPVFNRVGRRVAFVAADGALQTVALAGGAPQVVVTGRDVTSPFWSPAVTPLGPRLGFLSDGDIWTVPVRDGTATGPAEQLTAGGCGVESPSWSADGRHLAYVLRVRGADRTCATALRQTVVRDLLRGTLQVLPQHPGDRTWPRSLHYTADGRALVGFGARSATATQYQAVRYDLATGRFSTVLLGPIARLEHHDLTLDSVVPTPAGGYAITMSADFSDPFGEVFAADARWPGRFAGGLDFTNSEVFDGVDVQPLLGA